jgi:hypothetical protein
MTHTQQFIEDAIAGGWCIYHEGIRIYKDAMSEEYSNALVNRALLDPAAWQAVGKTRGWDEVLCPWRKVWHCFIDALASGDDIDTALGKLQ